MIPGGPNAGGSRSQPRKDAERAKPKTYKHITQEGGKDGKN